MTDTLKTLGSALLSTTSAAVYTAGAGVTTIVSSFRLVNISTSTVTCNMTGPSTMQVIPEDLSLAAGNMYVDSDPITLATAGALKAWASTGSSIHCSVFGIEHTT